MRSLITTPFEPAHIAVLARGEEVSQSFTTLRAEFRTAEADCINPEGECALADQWGEAPA